MGLFDEFEGEFAEIPDVIMGLPEGVHKCVLAGVNVEDKKTGKYLVFVYTAIEGNYVGKSHREFQRIVVGPALTDEDKQTMAYVKSRLSSLGVPVERMSTLTPDMITGIEVILTLVPQRNDPSYRNVSRVTLVDPSNVVPTLPTDAVSPVAPVASVDNPFE